MATRAERTSVAARPAGIGRRTAAFALDYLLILGYLVVLAAAGTTLTLGPAGGWWTALTSSPGRMDLVAFGTSVLPVILYFALLEGGERGATWGKRRLRLRVVRRGGGRLGTGRALARSAIKFLPWQLAHTCLVHVPGWPLEPQEPPVLVMIGMTAVWALVGLYVATTLVRRDRRAPYDMIAGSQVVALATETR
jgi:uncharacterized RDD family membrane protein YckC